MREQGAVTERLKAERIAVWGAGKSGIAAAKLLAHNGCDVTLYDDRATEQLETQLGTVAFDLVGGVYPLKIILSSFYHRVFRLTRRRLELCFVARFHL